MKIIKTIGKMLYHAAKHIDVITSAINLIRNLHGIWKEGYNAIPCASAA
ncbi:hypothetical protein RFF05_12005 [Bengtsoniella intestinalis]